MPHVNGLRPAKQLGDVCTVVRPAFASATAGLTGSVGLAGWARPANAARGGAVAAAPAGCTRTAAAGGSTSIMSSAGTSRRMARGATAFATGGGGSSPALAASAPGGGGTVSTSIGAWRGGKGRRAKFASRPQGRGAKFGPASPPRRYGDDLLRLRDLERGRDATADGLTRSDAVLRETRPDRRRAARAGDGFSLTLRGRWAAKGRPDVSLRRRRPEAAPFECAWKGENNGSPLRCQVRREGDLVG